MPITATLDFVCSGLILVPAEQVALSWHGLYVYQASFREAAAWDVATLGSLICSQDICLLIRGSSLKRLNFSPPISKGTFPVIPKSLIVWPSIPYPLQPAMCPGHRGVEETLCVGAPGGSPEGLGAAECCLPAMPSSRASLCPLHLLPVPHPLTTLGKQAQCCKTGRPSGSAECFFFFK